MSYLVVSVVSLAIGAFLGMLFLGLCVAGSRNDYTELDTSNKTDTEEAAKSEIE